MPTTRSAPPPAGWTLVEPYTVFLTIVLIGAVGFVAAGLVSDEELTLPRLPSHGWASGPRQVDRDRDFARIAAGSSAAQLALATLASKRAAGSTVKRTAARIRADHLKASQTLKTLASEKRWQLPATLDSESETTRSRLAKLRGPRFDRAYIDAIVLDHLADISEFEYEAAQGTDPALKRFAAEALPDLRTRLEMALRSQRALRTARR
jgi:putative membrane protein